MPDIVPEAIERAERRTLTNLHWVVKIPAVRAAAPVAAKNCYACPMTEKRWHVYLLRCADGTLYAGMTNDLPKRLAAHNAGAASRYTRSRLPVALAWSERCASRSAALRREAAIKRLTRVQKQALIRRAR